MPRTCPVLPRTDALPFGTDRAQAWRLIQDTGDVGVTEDDVYFVIGADAVEAAAKDHQTFSSAAAFDMVGSPFPLVPIAADPPVHSRYRRMLNKFFSPRTIAEHEDELRAQIDVLIDGILASGSSCEAVSALAVPFPSQAFLTLFGFPLADRDRLIGWKDAIVQLTNPQAHTTDPQLLGAAGELVEYLTSHIQDRRAGDGADLLSQLINDKDEGAITNEELIGMCFIFILAGLDTVTAAVGFALSALAQDVELRDTLRGDRDATMVFIEEMLRIDGPVPSVPRVTTTDVEVGDVTIPAGATCWLMLGAASRDPRRYANPDAIGDERRSHFAFGRGPHRCVGSHLALLELRLIIEQWLSRVPDFSLASAPEVIWPSASLSLRRLDLHIGAQR